MLTMPPTIEIAKLPKTALIDTGVFIRFLGERPDDLKSQKLAILTASPTKADAVLDN